MKRIQPNDNYRDIPCSVVSIGCAMGLDKPLDSLFSSKLHSDGYLSLDGMDALIRANMGVKKRIKYKRGERPCLRDFCHGFDGNAIVCVSGHFVYVSGGNYYSFFWNGDDEVISVWELTK